MVVYSGKISYWIFDFSKYPLSQNKRLAGVNIRSVHETDNTLYYDGTVVIKNFCLGSDHIAERSKKIRVYEMSPIKIRAALAALWYNRKKIKHCLFLTFTFPVDVDEKKAAECWDRLLDNIRKTYGIKNYVWVKEYQTKTRNIIHYHIVVDRVYVGIKRLQTTWNNVIKGVVPDCDIFNNNSVRLGNNPIVYNYQALAKYLSKYISKKNNIDKGLVFNARCYGFSENFVICRKPDSQELENLLLMYEYKVVVDDPFYTIIKIFDYVDTPENRICNFFSG